MNLSNFESSILSIDKIRIMNNHIEESVLFYWVQYFEILFGIFIPIKYAHKICYLIKKY